MIRATQSISPELIIIRVAFGQAFSHETAGQLSDVRFQARTRSNVTDVYAMNDSVTLDEVPATQQGYSGCDSATASRTGSNMELKIAEEAC